MNLRLAAAHAALLLPLSTLGAGEASGPVGFAAVNAEGVSTTTGGEGGRVVSVSTFDDLERFAAADEPCVIRVSGTISGSGMVRLSSDKTLIGSGSDAVFEGFGIHISGSRNIIIRNLSFKGADDDAINVQSFAHHVWIDHCDSSNAHDGLVDIKRGSSWITVSWNRFFDHGKTCLLGHSDDNEEQDDGRLKVTYHHNWFDGTNSRHPRVRFGECHVFNNFYDGVTGYGVASTEGADVLVEANYFADVDEPTLVGYGSSGPGDLVERDNVLRRSGAPQTAGTVFDPSTYYSYTPDAAADVPSIVRAGAGVGGFVPDPTGDAEFLRGDCSADGEIHLSDAVCVLDWLFRRGATPACVAATNSNGDEGIDVSDPTYLLIHLFLGGPSPVPPFPECGPPGSGTDRELGCETPPTNCQ